MRPTIYRFTINDRQVNPQYDEDVSVDIEQESSQQFHRKKLSSKIKLISDDYIWIKSQDFNTVFVLLVEESADGGKSWQTTVKGKFTKVDCAWDEDNQICEVQPDAWDDYNAVMEGIDNEYDIIPLAPATERVTIYKRPLLQIYIPGDDVITCFLAGTYYEQEVTDAIDDVEDLQNKYYFAEASKMFEIEVQGAEEDGVNTIYAGKKGTYTSLKGEYMMTYFERNELIATADILRYYNGYYISKVGSSDKLYVFEQYTDYDIFTPEDRRTYLDIPESLTFVRQTDEATASGTVRIIRAMMRYLLDVDSYNGKKTYSVPAEDIVENNVNYRYCIPFAIDLATISLSYSETPTQYGRTNDNRYFDVPYSMFGYKYFPISKSNWIWASIWLKYDIADWVNEENGRKAYQLKDAYTLASVISVLLGKISNVKHEAAPEYSQFLYSDRNPISGQSFELLLAPKSNIIKGEYDQPAQTAKTTLGTILNMLKYVYQCYWYIEDGKLKIEHVQYFRNGRSYSNTGRQTLDITQLYDPKGKPWAYLTNKYEYEKEQMPERYEFEWSDEVTTTFTGYPIEIISPYVSTGQVENVVVSSVTTDVDYILLNPNAISESGFVLLAAIRKNLWTTQPFFNTYNGYINSEGNAIYNADGDGKGWKYTIFDVVGGVTYELKDQNGNILDNVRWAFFSDETFLGLGNTTNGRITTPETCNVMKMSWRNDGDAEPVFLPYFDATRIAKLEEMRLSLPFVELEYDGAKINAQNGYLSFISLHPLYYTYDLPAKKVKINDAEMQLSQTSRHKKQELTIPYAQIDEFTAIKTNIGIGQIEKITLNLSSRTLKMTVKYDTE